MSRGRWIAVLASTAVALGLALWLRGPLRALLAPPDLEIHRIPSDALPPREPRSAPARGPLVPRRPEDWRWFIDEELAGRIAAFGEERHVFDPWTYARPAAHIDQVHPWPEHPDGAWRVATNSLGLREDGELASSSDVRILATGDSHTYGACNNDESWPSVLERMLGAALPGRTVEVLNAAADGYTFYNYQGSLLKFLSFEPQVFVVAVFGGNDFAGLTYLQHWFAGTPQQAWGQAGIEMRDAAIRQMPAVLGQCYAQTQMFRDFPEEIETMVAASVELVAEMREICAVRGIEMVLVFIPSPCECEWGDRKPAIERARQALRLTPADRAIDRRMEEDFLDRVRAAGVRVVGMRESFASQPEPPFWRRDLHVDLTGQRLIAQSVFPIVRALVAE